MHTGVIQGIDADADGGYLVTASDDKTARVWLRETGELLRVLRPPIGSGHEGRLYAVAMSPDGDLVAVGGYTALASEGEGFGVWVFERSSGHLVRRLGDLPNVVRALAFSKDGERLAVGSGRSVQVFRVETGALEGEDQRYGDDCVSVDFDAEGRLVTASWDGKLRLYERGLRRPIEERTEAGRRPAQARFSPDGQRIAVGFQDSPAVELRSSASLDLRGRPGVDGIDGGDLSRVAWSVDGARLCAGGRWNGVEGSNPVRCWAEGGRGGWTDHPVSEETVTGLRGLPDGAMAFSAADPRWGILSVTGGFEYQQDSPIADFRGQTDLLASNETGSYVNFAYDYGGYEHPAGFSLTEGRLGSRSVDANHTAITEVDGIQVTKWRGELGPELNGKPLIGIEPREYTRSLAFHPDRTFFVLGTEWNLRVYDTQGHPGLVVPLEAAAWGVTWSGDGEVLVAALDDGTIRWYRGEDLTLLATLYPHADRKRWIVWTPEGYYHMSYGGDSLVAWQKNRPGNGGEVSQSMNSLPERFYQPAYIARILAPPVTTGEISSTSHDWGCNIHAPQVRIVSPQETLFHESGESVELKIALRGPSCDIRVPAYRVEAKLDGLDFQTFEGFLPEEGTNFDPSKEWTLTLQLTGLPETDGMLTLKAWTPYASSKIVSIRVERVGPPPEIHDWRVFVLSIGVDDPARDLVYPAEDAKRFAEFWEQSWRASYREGHVTALVNESASRGAILDSLEVLIETANGDHDMVVVYLAGHGEQNDLLGGYHFKTGSAMEGEHQDYLTDHDLRSYLSVFPGKVVLFVDTCAAEAVGSIKGTPRGESGYVQFLVGLASVGNGSTVFAASRSAQSSYEEQKWDGGVFTNAVLQGLEGEAAEEGLVTVESLHSYVRRMVEDETAKSQTPRLLYDRDSGNFPLLYVPEN
ncbi:MAG: caspase family protein [Alphaproteobacteria bacterium]|nr:caspase family protein [Alphaproteobacteria bacterium]